MKLFVFRRKRKDSLAKLISAKDAEEAWQTFSDYEIEELEELKISWDCRDMGPIDKPRVIAFISVGEPCVQINAIIGG